MFRNFLDEADVASSTLDRTEEFDRRFNKMILIGTPDWVRGMIHRLHVCGVAEVSAWSRLLPTGKPGEVISTLLQYRGQTSP